jgi:outer membrane protein OmpA-like peptidoglycan-associated protein/opacity protein-like surface antigen
MPWIQAGASQDPGQEATMKFVARIFATMAVAFLLAFPLRADDTPKPGSTTKEVTTNKDEAANSQLAPGTAGEATPTAPTPTPVPQPGIRGSYTPRVELFLGYSNIMAAPKDLRNRIVDLNGGDTNIAFNFNRFVGLVGDFGGYHADTLTLNAAGSPSHDVGADGKVFTFMGGPRLSYRQPHFTLFAQALFGDADARKVTINGCKGSPACTPLLSENKFAMALGGGLDVNVHRHIAIRLVQAEYLLTRFRDPSSPAGTSGTRNDVRLSAGIVFRFGPTGPSPVPPSAACSVEPTEVFAGESVTATASESNFNPKRVVTYSWNGTGVRVAGSGSSTQIDTTGLQPGSYGATANLSDGSKNGVASCSAKFIVRQPRPPVISCSSNPPRVHTGGTSTIASIARSPDGRSLSYSYASSAGDISGNNATATLNARNAQPGAITVTCNVSDDRNPPLTASSTTIVTVEAPPAPAPEIAQLEVRLALHSIYFPTARPTTENPTGGLVESQEGILLALAQDFTKYLTYKPDAHLILGGHADQRGSEEYNKGLTERRVERTKSFLVEHGVPEDHIDTRSFGKDDNLTAEQVKQLMDQDPDLSPEDRKQMLSHLQVMVLANNRRVDVSLSTTGEQSIRRYPFNAKDYLTLISTSGGEKAPARRAPKKKE